VKDSFGRLSKPPHPELHTLLYSPAFARDAQEVLPLLLRVNAAHVVMLEVCEIIAPQAAAGLLRVNDEMTAALERQELPFVIPDSHRGLYAVFEHELIARAGAEAGGSVHVARSRNDINATVARLRVRQFVLAVAGDLLALQSSLLAQAAAQAASVMPGFTHFQPAQPATLGHYLLGVAAELDRAADRLLDADDRLDACPMGACAGFGTSFAIRPELVAGLLGFSAPAASSLDAVASRDFAVEFLAAVAMLGTTLTRLASDLQLWASNAFRFLGWPDDFVSTSSIMPQKRNAFVLETIRGKSATAAGEWVAAVMGLKNTPFTNGIEVSAEVVERAAPAAADTSTALRLMGLLIDHMETDTAAMERAARAGDITATALTDVLVRNYGVAFRTAHEAVSRLVSSGTDRTRPADVAAELRRILDADGALRPDDADSADGIVADIAAALDPRAVVAAAVAGGGPAPSSLARQLDALQTSADGQRQRLNARKTTETAAAERLRKEVDRILAGAGADGRRAERS
jgi:argininosuccinate lyase